MRENRKTWPLKVRSGQSAVTVYKIKIRGVNWFQLRWEEAGKIRRKTIPEERKAVAEAEWKADQLRAGEVEAVSLSVAQSAVYKQALEDCGDVPLDVVCREWAEARRQLGAVPLLSAVEEYRRRHFGKPLTMEVAVQEFMDGRRRAKASEVYLNRLNDRLDRFAEAFNGRDLKGVTEQEIREYVEGRGGAARTQKNVRDGIVTLWRWARKAGYLPRDLQTEAERVEAPQVKRALKIGIFTPDEIGALLAAAGDKVRPAMAICAFAGIRSQGELKRLRWEHFRWEQGVIDLSTVEVEDGSIEAVSKTGERRLVPILPNLREWLKGGETKTGPVMPLLKPDAAFRRVARDAGVQWKQNALRHSFGSYRVAATKSVDQTSLEMGNSPTMVRKHYLEAVLEEEARAWFEVRP